MSTDPSHAPHAIRTTRLECLSLLSFQRQLPGPSACLLITRTQDTPTATPPLVSAIPQVSLGSSPGHAQALPRRAALCHACQPSQPPRTPHPRNGAAPAGSPLRIHVPLSRACRSTNERKPAHPSRSPPVASEAVRARHPGRAKAQPAPSARSPRHPLSSHVAVHQPLDPSPFSRLVPECPLSVPSASTPSPRLLTDRHQGRLRHHPTPARLPSHSSHLLLAAPELVITFGHQHCPLDDTGRHAAHWHTPLCTRPIGKVSLHA